MKRLFAIILAFSAMTAMNAQTPTDTVDSVATQTPRDNVIRPFKRPLMLSVSFGKNINTGGNDNAYWFGRQPAVVNQTSFRLTWMFKPQWGIYGDFYFNSCSDWTPPIDIDWWEDDEYRTSGGAGIGVVYRYERGRWQLYARVGIGVGNRGEGPDLTHYIDYDDTEWLNSCKEKITAYRLTGITYADLGVTGGYRLSRVFSVIMDVNYHYPCSSSKVEFTHKTNPRNGSRPKILDRQTYTSRSWGNCLTFSIGLQLQCELSKR